MPGILREAKRARRESPAESHPLKRMLARRIFLAALFCYLAGWLGFDGEPLAGCWMSFIAVLYAMSGVISIGVASRAKQSSVRLGKLFATSTAWRKKWMTCDVLPSFIADFPAPARHREVRIGRIEFFYQNSVNWRKKWLMTNPLARPQP
jgi:hypothetical protein